MKHWIILIGLLFGGLLRSQVISWNNSSFEGTAPGSSITPPNWTACGGSPDTQPGCWGATPAASHGSSYVGMVQAVSFPGSQESCGQVLPAPMVAGTPYSISMRLVNLDIYNGSWNGGAVVEIFGGSSACNLGQLLWTSGSFVNSSWATYNALFTPTSNWTSMVFRVSPGVASTWPAVGIDNLTSSVILPARLEIFNARLENGEALINWQTSLEQAMEGYTVQRSGSDMDFQDLETVPATGSNGLPQDYRFVDTNLPEGLSFYRLRMNDQNGSSTFTEVREILYSSTGDNLAVKTMFPNPANAVSRLDIISLLDQKVTISAQDVAGRKAYEATFELSIGENRIEIPTADWLAGLYHLQLQSSGKVITKSMVVAH